MKTCVFSSAHRSESKIRLRSRWEAGAHKSILRKTKLREAFVATAGEVTVVESDGTHTTKIDFRVPVNTYQRVLERTTRGLYFFHTGRILPAAVPVSVTMLAGTPSMDTDEIRILNVETIGDGACVYRYGVVPEDVDCSLWIYDFHHAHWAMVTTGAVERGKLGSVGCIKIWGQANGTYLRLNRMK